MSVTIETQIQHTQAMAKDFFNTAFACKTVKDFDGYQSNMNLYIEALKLSTDLQRKQLSMQVERIGGTAAAWGLTV